MSYAAVVVVAVIEEYTLRGYFVALLSAAIGSTGLAVVLVGVLHALLHGRQDPLAALRSFLLALALGTSVVLSGVLLPSVIARVAAELASTTWKARVARAEAVR